MSFRNYYDTSTYVRSRDKNRTNTSSASTERPTTVTAKYINSTPSYKSSSIPIICSERSLTKEDTPISTIASRYSNYNKNEKPTSKYEKKDYSKLTVPSISTNRDKSRDVSPVSTASKYSISRSTRRLSPDRRTAKSFKDKLRDPSPADRDKDIPTKTDKLSSYNSLSSYKLYSRTSNYTRPPAKVESKPEITVNRYAIANRLSSSYLRSPTTVKRTSVSPVSQNENVKIDNEKSLQVPPTIIVEETIESLPPGTEKEDENEENETETITIVTRHTSPTPPGSSAYVRSRRADMAKTIEKSITRPIKRPEMCDKEVQSDRLDDSTRLSRFGSTARSSTTNWSYYSPNTTSYTGYAGRYSTQYSTLKDNSNINLQNDRRSRSHSTEPPPKDNIYDNNSQNNSGSNLNEDIISVYGQNKHDDTSEIVINVNLKLKRATSPPSITEIVSPEITISNSQLPPQVPKTESGIKLKKPKIRKSSTDSSTDSSSKKKVIKRRSKSVSSTDSDQGSEVSDKSSGPKSKSVKKTSSSNSLQNSFTKVKHSKSRESNSPESSITLSTQSSISEDENAIKSKSNDVSRTIADEISMPTDKSARQVSPVTSQKCDSGTEEAKSFLIRALAPVTNLFKMKHHDSIDNNRHLDSTVTDAQSKDFSNFISESEKYGKNKNLLASNDDDLVILKAIRPIESGERAWWLDSDTHKINSSANTDNRKSASDRDIPKQIRHEEFEEQPWCSETSGEKKKGNLSPNYTLENCNSSNSMKQTKFIEEEKPWWLDSNANIPEGIERLTPTRKSSSDSDKSEKCNYFKVHHTESGDQKDWWIPSNENTSTGNKPESQNLSRSGSERNFTLRRIRHIESGERPWWLSSEKNIPEGIERLPTPPLQQESDSSDSEDVQVFVHPSQVPPFPLHLPDDEPLGDRRSPEGLETPKENEYFRGRTSPYENSYQYRNRNSGHSYQKGRTKYISRYTDIDDILGTSGQIYRPFMDSILAKRTGQIAFDDDECEEIDPTQVRIHDSTPQRPVIKKIRSRNNIMDFREEDQLDDATLQVFKDGDYGPYLDLDSTLGEQDEELEGLQDNRKNSLVLRTQLSVRVHAIIEQLLRSQGRELRKALFSLKQILQTDKDLVHEFVANKGLDCLMQVGNMADHNYLDYILRALGQILLYVDGMHGVMAHKHCVQWLYSLIASKFRHVVKTTLKLLLVFVEYTENNCLLLINAITQVDGSNGRPLWHNVMKILQDNDASDTELLIYATTLINRCLNNIPNRETYYDQIDALQDQCIDDIIRLYMSKQGTDLDLLREFQIFEAVLLFEDGDESGTALKQLDESIINSLRRRSLNLNISERRKSKKQTLKEKAKLPVIAQSTLETKIPNNNRCPLLPILDNKENKELTTALKRRRDKCARQAHHIIQQQEMMNNSNIIYNGLFQNTSVSDTETNTNIKINSNSNGNANNTNSTNQYTNGVSIHTDKEEPCIKKTTKNNNLTDVLKNGNQRYTSGLKQRIQNGTLGHSVSAADCLAAMRLKQMESPEAKDDREILLNKEHSIKDLAQKLTSPVSLTIDDKPLRVSDMAGIVLKAKEGLAKSQSKEIIKSPSVDKSPKVPDIKLSESDLNWEELEKKCRNRSYYLCDLDFSDLQQESDEDLISPTINASSGPPPPPPSIFPCVRIPPPLPDKKPILKNYIPIPPPKLTEAAQNPDKSIIKKSKKTVKLFWKEIQEAPVSPSTKEPALIWDNLPEISFDKAVLEHLFEAKSNDLVIKKLSDPKRNLILNAKRSNAINIAIKKLPTPQTIKAAVMKMDVTVIGREGIDKLLAMMPTEEEKLKIHEAQFANPDLPLGSAEQFLLTLASINELSSRLKLWVFKLDFDNLEKEIAEPLMDLKQGIDLLKVNKTFKIILSTLRTVGSFLNGNYVKGFRLEYLSKVTEVKDTVHKHPLLYHICEIIIEKFPESTDLFSEVGPVIRASKVDFDILSTNLQKLESDCKASWEHMTKIAKYDASQIFKTKINEFLTDAAQRIILLTRIKRKVMNRYNKFLFFLGVPNTDIIKTKPSDLLKVIAEFALEYRTTRERVLLQLEKKANHRERNKTRGKMIIEVGNYSHKNGEHKADKALKELLKSDPETDSFTERRRKSQRTSMFVNGELSPDDEIIESLVRSATVKPNPQRLERRRQYRSQNMNLNKRTLDGN